MSKPYLQKRKEEAEERMEPPKNQLREEELIINNLLFPAQENATILENQHHIDQLAQELAPRRQLITRQPTIRENIHLPRAVVALRSSATIQNSELPQDTPQEECLEQKQEEYQPEMPINIVLQDEVCNISDNSGQIHMTKKVKVEDAVKQDKAEPAASAGLNMAMDDYLHECLQNLRVESRCMRCGTNRRMLETYLTAAKNGRLLVVGKCCDCDYKLSRFAPKEITIAKKSKLEYDQQKANSVEG